MMHHEKNYTGNSRFYGFCVDLLVAVARKVGFSYRLELVPDRKYGARDPETGEWNGIVKELMRHVRFGLFLFLTALYLDIRSSAFLSPEHVTLPSFFPLAHVIAR